MENKPQQIIFTINNDRLMWVNALTISYTYLSYMGGTDFEWHNNKIIERLKCPSDWGEVKTHIIFPDGQDFKRPLPLYTFKAWLNSEPLNNAFSGSHFVLIWFANINDESLFRKTIEEGVKDLEWEKYAVDYDF